MYYRVHLLKLIVQMDLSESIGEKIVELVCQAPQGSKESTAESIVKKMEKCKTEEEVIRALELF